jgi:AcrR family transcriptional regulator
MTTARVTRGGWSPSGVSADRRAAMATSGKAVRTRAAILDAARSEFARRGFANTTVEHIVEAAGVARGSFYTYFESRMDVFRHLTARIDREIRSNVVAFDRGRGSDPIENLRASNRNYLAVVRANADLYRLVDEVAAHDDDVRKARLKSRQDHVARVARSIDRWKRTGWADPSIDPQATSAALVSMLSSFAQWIHVSGDVVDDSLAEKTVTDIWIRACGLRSPSDGR